MMLIRADAGQQRAGRTPAPHAFVSRPVRCRRRYSVICVPPAAQSICRVTTQMLYEPVEITLSQTPHARGPGLLGQSMLQLRRVDRRSICAAKSADCPLPQAGLSRRRPPVPDAGQASRQTGIRWDIAHQHHGNAIHVAIGVRLAASTKASRPCIHSALRACGILPSSDALAQVEPADQPSSSWRSGPSPAMLS